MLLAQEGPLVLELRSTAVLGAGTNSNAAPDDTGDESQTGSSPAGFKTKSGTRCSAKSHHSGVSSSPLHRRISTGTWNRCRVPVVACTAVAYCQTQGRDQEDRSILCPWL